MEDPKFNRSLPDEQAKAMQKYLQEQDWLPFNIQAMSNQSCSPSNTNFPSN